MTTLNDIKARFGGSYSNITQVDSKKLFICTGSKYQEDHATILVSYTTPVAYKQDNVWFVTRTRYSVATSKQLNQFLRGLVWEYTDNI